MPIDPQSTIARDLRAAAAKLAETDCAAEFHKLPLDKQRDPAAFTKFIADRTAKLEAKSKTISPYPELQKAWLEAAVNQLNADARRYHTLAKGIVVPETL